MAEQNCLRPAVPCVRSPIWDNHDPTFQERIPMDRTSSFTQNTPWCRETIANSDLMVSPLCYGVMRFNLQTRGEADFERYRQYRDAGGNFFDTAHVYAAWLPHGNGASEIALGECLRRFGDRDQVVILTKGALPGMGSIYPRPADCMTPEIIAADISESLERLQIDTIDIYMLHRDDPRHPVGEIIETLNVEIARGRVRYLGASNWPTARIAAANDYAKAHDLKGFVISSPQWNLGQQNHLSVLPDGTYDQSVVPMSREDVRWHAACQFPVMPWNPTAYGYFADARSPNPMSFDNPTSGARRERARQLATTLGCSPTQVALAFLRSHPFPVFPVVGTLDPEHLADALGAASIRLNAHQVAWLRDG
jgi:aryl-alcohol dehydrogenase-like predicted oxidoreductase